MYALIILFVFGVISLFLGFGKLKNYAMASGFIGLLLAAISLVYEKEILKPAPYFNEMISMDNYAFWFSMIVVLFSALVFLLSSHYYRYKTEHITDIYGLLLFSITGAVVLCSFSDLTMLFLGIEMMSIPVYILAASHRDYAPSNEAGLKYFIMGAFATGFLLLGITLIFGHSHSFNMNDIKVQLTTNGQSVIFKIGTILLMAGLLFKVALAPFHFWSPDVYHGAPSIITLFMSTVVKIAAFAALFRFINLGFEDNSIWVHVISIIAILTMIIGNFGALVQSKFKRFMAYSGVANSALMVLPILAYSHGNYQSLWLYLTAYSAGNIILFAIYMLTKDAAKSEENSQFEGLLYTYPLLAILGIIALASMAGIPPLAGFFAKFMVITQAFQKDLNLVSILSLVFSVFAIYYYFRIAVSMCIRSNSTISLQLSVPGIYKIVMGICGLILLGIVLLLPLLQ